MYRDDIFDCYQTNRLVFDSQNPIKITTPDIAAEFIRKFVLWDYLTIARSSYTA